ncbi:hypothetical protein Bca101_019603 [Brassica carinata]
MGSSEGILDQMQYWIILSTKTRIGGAAWVVRDSKGMVLLHSKFTFSNMDYALEAALFTFLWCIQNMISHRFPNVILALDNKNLAEGIRPKAA